MRHRLLLPLFLLTAGSLAAGEPILGTFALDPVLLLKEGQEVAGREDLAIEHAQYRYLFSSEKTRDTFRARPTSYEIQLGGACARMGALSGLGRTSIFTVHEDRLYLFASDQCRQTFLRDPSGVLEPLEDPAPSPSDADARARGKALIARTVTWLGGAGKLDRAVVRVHRKRTVEHRGQEYRNVETVTVGPGGFLRNSGSWDDDTWTKVLSPDDAFFIDPGNRIRSMQPSQRRSLERQYQSHVLALLQSREHADFVATSPAEAAGSTRTIHVRFQGMNHTLTVDPESGQIHDHTFVGWSPGMVLGTIERTYTKWETISGVKVPMAWEHRLDGETLPAVDQITEGYEVKVSTHAPEGTFERPGTTGKL